MKLARLAFAAAVTAASCADSPPPSRVGLRASVAALDAPSSSRPRLPPPPPNGPVIALMTFNLNYGMAGDGSTVDAIAAHDADVVLLQETNAVWERAIRHKLGRAFRDIRFHDPERFAPGGMGVLSKLPIVKETVVPSAVDWFPSSVLVVETAAGPVQLVNVHLHPMVSESGSWVSGYFTTGGLRLREIRAIEEVVDPTLPTIWAGDFNEAEDAGGIASLWAKGFSSALPEKDTRAITWHWDYESVPLALRLDHVLYERERFALLDVDVHEEGRSDHYPVAAKLKMRIPN